MPATPGKPARTPASLFEAGLAHLDQAAEIARRGMPVPGEVIAAATLATAHFVASQASLQMIRDHRAATEENDAKLTAYVSELRRLAALNGWTEIGGDADLTFVCQKAGGAGQWRLVLHLGTDAVRSVTLNDMVVGNDQAPNVLRNHGMHASTAPDDNVVAWRPSPTARRPTS